MITSFMQRKTVVEDVEDPVGTDQSGRCKKDGWYIMTLEISCQCTNRIQIIWKNCNTECKERDSYRKSVKKNGKLFINQYYEKEKDVVTGIVQRYVGKNVSINLGKADAMLTENEHGQR